MSHKTLFTTRYSDVALMSDVEPRIPMTLNQMKAHQDSVSIVERLNRGIDVLEKYGRNGRMTMEEADRLEAEHFAEIYG